LFKIYCVYLEKIHYNYKTILNINPKGDTILSIKYICGHLNSKLFSFYNSSTSNKIEAKDFPRLSVKDLKQFPIREVDSSIPYKFEIQNLIILLVKQIQTELKLNPYENVKSFDSEIDKLVYELNGLTKEKIKIVECR